MSQSRAERKFRRRIEAAVRLLENGDFDSAIGTLEALLQRSPASHQPEVLNYLATIAHGIGDNSRALAYLYEIAKLTPNDTEAWCQIGNLYLEVNDFENSIKAYERLVELAPNNAEPLIQLGNALLLNESYARAIHVYHTALDPSPPHPTGWASPAKTLLLEGQWEEGLSAAQRQLSISPGHIGGLALKSVALQELNLEAELRELVDFDRLICSFDITPDRGEFRNIKAFNQELVTYCNDHPSLRYEPTNNTTRVGWQTSDMSQDDVPVIDQLLKMIETCIHQYMRDHPVDTEHQFLKNRPTNWDYSIWGTILNSHGHQVSHIHNNGWLSGVYYTQLPSTIVSSAKSDNTDGWIEFGRPHNPKSVVTPKIRTYQPIEGRLYLFPSYFYHRTVPFEADIDRISIAFDLIPRN